MRRSGRSGNRELCRADEPAQRAEIAAAGPGYRDPRQEAKGGKKVR
jgi:hypothetical protein